MRAEPLKLLVRCHRKSLCAHRGASGTGSRGPARSPTRSTAKRPRKLMRSARRQRRSRGPRRPCRGCGGGVQFSVDLSSVGSSPLRSNTAFGARCRAAWKGRLRRRFRVHPLHDGSAVNESGNGVGQYGRRGLFRLVVVGLDVANARVNVDHGMHVTTPDQRLAILALGRTRARAVVARFLSALLDVRRSAIHVDATNFGSIAAAVATSSSAISSAAQRRSHGPPH